jgi:hydroxymethylpyrimidine/phosphomethylpyrimidine kinase
MSDKSYKRVLTIAGSDSGGGAGIQADLKTISALGCYGMTVITAITAQNTVAVTAINEIPISIIKAQLDAVLSDIGVDAVKIGMLQSPEVIHTIADVLQEYSIQKIVLDPVMIAKSGDKLLRDDAIETLKSELFPLVTIITPNLPEAEVLTGLNISSRAEMEEGGLNLLKTGPEAVLVKGGHSIQQKSADCLISKNEEPKWFESARIPTKNTHGTGCTLSSAIASFIAKGYSLADAVAYSKKYINGAIEAGSEYKLGNGHGPVHHFYKIWS